MFLAIPTLAEPTTESEYVLVVELKPADVRKLREYAEIFKKHKKARLLRFECKHGTLYERNTRLSEDADEAYKPQSDEVLHWAKSLPLEPLTYPPTAEDAEEHTPACETVEGAWVDVRENAISFRHRIDIGDNIMEVVDSYDVSWATLEKLFPKCFS